ncbi:hypothetical protein [Clostridium grantii]|uniref:Uncharacterized protein n=1 Tax=Clostridium grantii DSM 8605 TaxID=1121316 RepID=A0A1M5RRY5_9CLOT|nr:hypothetical protein [Clostridium grantii]SHH28583.1 hypothetical protein SAMN02745207_00664 [Clostridium grantii DSM 8605]
MIITKEHANDFKIFSDWLNSILGQKLASGIIAFNFNLYEGEEETYDIQLIGSDDFDENDADWACTDYFTTGEDICYIKRTKDIESWEKGLEYITSMVIRYLNEGKYANILKEVFAIGIGFVDGGIDIIYHT